MGVHGMEMRRYDANCILGSWADGGPTYRHAAELLAAMDALGIGRALVRHSLGAGYDPAYANALLRQEVVGADRLTPCWTVIPPQMGDCVGGDIPREAMAVALAHPNVYLDICGSTLARAELEAMVAEVGAERILFGTDNPWLDPRFLIGKVAYARLSAEQQRLILGENIARLMGWD